MNTIKGMISDLEKEDTYISGCTTKGEIITMLKNLENSVYIEPSATNGDVVKTIFSNVEIIEKVKDTYKITLDNTNELAPTLIVFSSWWNAPYKKSEKNINLSDDKPHTYLEKWIPIDEESPKIPTGKKYIKCLCYGKEYFVPDHVDQPNWEYSTFLAVYFDDGRWLSCYGDYDIIAWMPLPKPYEIKNDM